MSDPKSREVWFLKYGTKEGAESAGKHTKNARYPPWLATAMGRDMRLSTKRLERHYDEISKYMDELKKETTELATQHWDKIRKTDPDLAMLHRNFDPFFLEGMIKLNDVQAEDTWAVDRMK